MGTMSLAIFFILVLIISRILENKNDKKFKEALKKQNQRIVIANYSDIDILNECFKEKSFFELINSGKNLCEVEKIEYIQYSNKEDYFF